MEWHRLAELGVCNKRKSKSLIGNNHLTAMATALDRNRHLLATTTWL